MLTYFVVLVILFFQGIDKFSGKKGIFLIFLKQFLIMLMSETEIEALGYCSAFAWYTTHLEEVVRFYGFSGVKKSFFEW